MTDGNAAHKPSIFVVTAGVSVRGNLARLGSYRSIGSDDSVIPLLSECLACIGPLPRRRDPVVEVAEALGLEASSGGQSRNAPSGEEAESPLPSASCGGSEGFRGVAEQLHPDPGRPSTRGLSAELSSMFADGAPLLS